MEEKEKTIYLNSYINEIYATTEVTQYFVNTLDHAIELSIFFPIKEEINLTKFIVATEDKILCSKVMSKKKAEEKYSDTISSGNTGFISRYDNEKMKNYSVNIGNINPKQKIKLNSYFIQMIGAQDMSFEFNIIEKYPTFHYNELYGNNSENIIIKANLKLETQSKITRLIAPFINEEEKNSQNYEVKFSNDFKTANITYIIYEDKLYLPGSYLSFCILFRTENMNKPILYYQYNPECKETSYAINYIFSSKKLKNIPIQDQPDQDNKISYYLKYQEKNINDTPGLFIFLIDQSGSMSGKSIDLVKQSLLLFIQSLPLKSYFQLIGFGSDYKKYNSEPVEYNQENVKNITNIINRLEADMGGTNISGPLDCIYKNDNYSKINLSKNIFILTDGQVFDKEECFNLISINSNKFRIHSLGIGNDFDRDLIEQSGKLGKGSSSFVENVENINSAVIDSLNKCLREYITDIKFNFQNYQNNISNDIIKCTPINNFTYQDEIMNYSFILDEKNKIDIDNLSQSIKIEISCKDPINIIKENVSFINNKNIIKLKDGDEMSKMIVGKGLKNNKEFKENENKEIEFAKKYQMLSKNTALFAEMKNNGDNKQTKLIQVFLNDYEQRNNIDYFHSQNIDSNNLKFHATICGNMIFKAPDYNIYNNYNTNYYSYKQSNNYRNYIGNGSNYGLHRNNVYGSSGTVISALNYDHEENMRMIEDQFQMERLKENNRHELRKREYEFDSCKERNLKDLNNLELKREGGIRELINPLSSNEKYDKHLMALGNQRIKDSERHLKLMKCLDNGLFERNKDIEKLKFERELKEIDKNEKMELQKIMNPPKNNQIKENITNLILSQDIIKGFWDENEETRKLINIINKEYNSINKKVKELNKEEQEIKIIFTILVIYYLNTKYTEKINDYRLIINKATKYLDEQGIIYDDFINGI